jgi:poly(3-hydroxybutyrate) depolymerase
MTDLTQSLIRQYEHSVPAFWPIGLIAEMGQEGLEIFKRNLDFAKDIEKDALELKPVWATPNDILLDLNTLRLRDFSPPTTHQEQGVIPTLIDPPYAGHTSTITDYAPGKSLVEVLQAGSEVQRDENIR